MFLLRLRTLRSPLLSLLLIWGTSITPVQAVNFSLPNLDGQSINLADFHGQWVIVNFWARWCTPCLLEMPELEAFHQAQNPRVSVLGINYEEASVSQIRPLIEKLGITFPILLSGGQPLPGWEIKGLPTTFLISPTGQIVDVHLGAVTADLLTERIKAIGRKNCCR